MAFPTIRAIATPSDTPVATSHTLGLPTSPVAGNLLLLFVGTGSQPTITDQVNDFDAAGFTTLFYSSEGVAGLIGGYWIVGKVAAGGEGSISLNTSANAKLSSLAIEVQDWGGNIATDVAIAQQVNSTGTNAPNPPSLTPSWGAADTLWLTGVSSQNTQASITGPANYTVVSEALATLSSDASMSLYSRELNAASEDPAAFALTSIREGIAYTIAIRPAAAGGGGGGYVHHRLARC
jgi:hypothetical protein